MLFKVRPTVYPLRLEFLQRVRVWYDEALRFNKTEKLEFAARRAEIDKWLMSDDARDVE
jgi:hypothetical protein